MGWSPHTQPFSTQICLYLTPSFLLLSFIGHNSSSIFSKDCQNISTPVLLVLFLFMLKVKNKFALCEFHRCSFPGFQERELTNRYDLFIIFNEKLGDSFVFHMPMFPWISDDSVLASLLQNTSHECVICCLCPVSYSVYQSITEASSGSNAIISQQKCWAPM